MASYSMQEDVRRLTGITDTSIISDDDIEEFIADADASIVDKLTVPTPLPRLIKRLSSLLAAIDVYNRPDLRMGFKIGELTINTRDIEKSLQRWKVEANEIILRYLTGVEAGSRGVIKSSSYTAIDEDLRYND